MTAKEHATAIRQRLDSLADPAVRAKLTRTVPGAKLLGIPVPALREFAGELRAAIPFDTACDLFDLYTRERCREEILVATFRLAAEKKSIARLPWPRLEKWIRAVDNWETCDQLASNVVAVRVHSEVALARKIVDLIHSPDKWQRRMAAATAASLNQKGRSHPEIAIEVCEWLVPDPEPMIQKSLAWVIRELCKNHADRAAAFLAKERHRLPKSTFRDASAKLRAV